MALFDTHTIFDKTERSLGTLRNLLCLITCVDMDLLANAPPSEQKKYTSLGVAMLITTVLAFFSAYIAIDYVIPEIRDLALSTAGKKVAAIALSLFWMMIIFNLQRFVVSGTGRTAEADSAGVDDLIRSLPAIVMSVVIGMMVAIPLAVAIFKPEIDMHLRVDQERKFVEQTNEREERSYSARLHACTEFYRYQAGEQLPLIRCLPRSKGETIPLLETATAADGQAPSKPQEAGASPDKPAAGAAAAPAAAPAPAPAPAIATTAVQANEGANPGADAQTALLERAPEPSTIQDLLASVKRRDAEDSAEATQHEERNKLGGGLIARASVLFEQVPFFAYSFMLLVIFIQLTPVLIKMMSAKSAYDYLQDMLDRLVVAGGGLPPEMAKDDPLAIANPAYGGIEINAVAVYDDRGEGKPLTLYHRADEVKERYRRHYQEKIMQDWQRLQSAMQQRYQRLQKLSSAA